MKVVDDRKGFLLHLGPVVAGLLIALGPSPSIGSTLPGNPVEGPRNDSPGLLLLELPGEEYLAPEELAITGGRRQGHPVVHSRNKRTIGRVVDMFRNFFDRMFKGPPSGPGSGRSRPLSPTASSSGYGAPQQQQQQQQARPSYGAPPRPSYAGSPSSSLSSLSSSYSGNSAPQAAAAVPSLPNYNNNNYKVAAPAPSAPAGPAVAAGFSAAPPLSDAAIKILPAPNLATGRPPASSYSSASPGFSSAAGPSSSSGPSGSSSSSGSFSSSGSSGSAVASQSSLDSYGSPQGQVIGAPSGGGAFNQGSGQGQSSSSFSSQGFSGSAFSSSSSPGPTFSGSSSPGTSFSGLSSSGPSSSALSSSGLTFPSSSSSSSSSSSGSANAGDSYGSPQGPVLSQGSSGSFPSQSSSFGFTANPFMSNPSTTSGGFATPSFNTPSTTVVAGGGFSSGAGGGFSSGLQSSSSSLSGGQAPDSYGIPTGQIQSSGSAAAAQPVPPGSLSGSFFPPTFSSSFGREAISSNTISSSNSFSNSFSNGNSNSFSNGNSFSNSLSNGISNGISNGNSLNVQDVYGSPLAPVGTSAPVPEGIIGQNSRPTSFDSYSISSSSSSNSSSKLSTSSSSSLGRTAAGEGLEDPEPRSPVGQLVSAVEEEEEAAESLGSEVGDGPLFENLRDVSSSSTTGTPPDELALAKDGTSTEALPGGAGAGEKDNEATEASLAVDAGLEEIGGEPNPETTPSSVLEDEEQQTSSTTTKTTSGDISDAGTTAAKVTRADNTSSSTTTTSPEFYDYDAEGLDGVLVKDLAGGSKSQRQLQIFGVDLPDVEYDENGNPVLAGNSSKTSTTARTTTATTRSTTTVATATTSKEKISIFGVELPDIPEVSSTTPKAAGSRTTTSRTPTTTTAAKDRQPVYEGKRAKGRTEDRQGKKFLSVPLMIEEVTEETEEPGDPAVFLAGSPEESGAEEVEGTDGGKDGPASEPLRQLPDDLDFEVFNAEILDLILAEEEKRLRIERSGSPPTSEKRALPRKRQASGASGSDWSQRIRDRQKQKVWQQLNSNRRTSD